MFYGCASKAVTLYEEPAGHFSTIYYLPSSLLPFDTFIGYIEILSISQVFVKLGLVNSK